MSNKTEEVDQQYALNIDFKTCCKDIDKKQQSAEIDQAGDQRERKGH